MEIIYNYEKQTTNSWTNPWKYTLQCTKLTNFANQTT